MRHRALLIPLLAPVLLRRTRSNWLAALEAAKVPCGPINSLDDVFADPQVLARQMTLQVAHPHNSALELVASPMKLSATPVQLRRAPPLLGQHTAEVLRELGLGDGSIAALKARGTI